MFYPLNYEGMRNVYPHWQITFIQGYSSVVQHQHPLYLQQSHLSAQVHIAQVDLTTYPTQIQSLLHIHRLPRIKCVICYWTVQVFSMNQYILGLIVLLLVGIAVLLFGLYTRLRDVHTREQPGGDTMLLLQQQLQELSKTMDKRMSDTYTSMSQTQQHMHKTLQEQFSQNAQMIQGISGQSTKMIQQITEKLTHLDRTNQQVIGFSEQLTNLERVLTSQKQRGNLGEASLRLVLENMLPPTAFSLQHQFEDGDTVDAAIFSKDGIIPVDAKFSLENYVRLSNEDDPAQRGLLEREFRDDLKRRIDETSKYIKPKDGTLDFAFMFIPAEAIYYDLLVNEVGAVKVNTRTLLEYAFTDKKVIIVSPTTFAAYLQTVLQGLRALQIEEGAKAIAENVEKLGRHINAYESFMRKLGTTLGTTVNHYNAAYKELGKIDKDVVKITDGSRQIEPMEVDKPKSES
jgi:DNA recombination protein RmuC